MRNGVARVVPVSTTRHKQRRVACKSDVRRLCASKGIAVADRSFKRMSCMQCGAVVSAKLDSEQTSNPSPADSLMRH
jgi:hypothetical protein